MANSLYRLFAGNEFSKGGYRDFIKKFKTVRDATKYIEDHSEDRKFTWSHIVCDDALYIEGIKKDRWEWSISPYSNLK